MLGTVENKISVAPLQILPRFKKAKNCVLGFPRGGVLGIPRTYWQSTLGPWFSKESLDFQWDMSPWIFQDVSCDRSLDFQGVSCDRTLDFQGLCWAWSPWISKDMRIGLGVLDNGPWVIDTSMTVGPFHLFLDHEGQKSKKKYGTIIEHVISNMDLGLGHGSASQVLKYCTVGCRRRWLVS